MEGFGAGINLNAFGFKTAAYERGLLRIAAGTWKLYSGLTATNLL